MSTEANKDLVRKSVESLDAGDFEKFIDFFASDYVHHDPSHPEVTNRESLGPYLDAVAAAFPDMQQNIEDLVAEGDKVAKRYVINCTHKGEVAGIPPTNNRIAVHGTSVYRIENGKFVEGWHLTDNMGLMQQIGAFPSQ